MKKQKDRIDQALVALGLASSRSEAQRLVMSGAVLVDGQVVDKPGARIALEAGICVTEAGKYVGRGGQKLEAALDAFHVDVAGFHCLDVGASTGGFTDCLLQRGANWVVALDVGFGQLHWKLRQDPRVTAIERCNARHLTPAHLPPGSYPFDLIVADVSFISLTLVLPPALALLHKGGCAIVLIKPQFEAGRQHVGKGGIVTDPAARQSAINKIRDFTSAQDDLQWSGCIESPITGADGNIEYLACLTKNQ